LRITRSHTVEEPLINFMLNPSDRTSPAKTELDRSRELAGFD
jgi:hypothetical protein